MAYGALALGWAVWGLIHSGLATTPAKQYLSRRSSFIDCHWRPFFSLVAVLTLVPMVYWTWRLDGPFVLVWPNRWLPAVLSAGGLALGWAGMRAFGGGASFLGVEGFLDRCDDNEPDQLVKTGLLGWIRHPLYTSAVILLWAHNHRASWLTASVVLTVYVLVGAGLEERRLARRLGPRWRRYRREVSAFVPIKKIQSWFS